MDSSIGRGVCNVHITIAMQEDDKTGFSFSSSQRQNLRCVFLLVLTFVLIICFLVRA